MGVKNALKYTNNIYVHVSRYSFVSAASDVRRTSPRKPRRAVFVLSRRRRRRGRWRREQIGERGQRRRRPGRPRPVAIRRRLLLLLLLLIIIVVASVYFGVGPPLHFTFVRAHIGNRHWRPIVDPRERLTVTEQQNLANRLKQKCQINIQDIIIVPRVWKTSRLSFFFWFLQTGCVCVCVCDNTAERLLRRLTTAHL